MRTFWYAYRFVMWHMQERRIYILIILVAITLNLQAQTDTLFSDFLNKFPGKEIEPKFLVKFLNFESKYLEQRMRSQKITAEEIVRRNDNYIIVLVDMQCGAGGICESTTLYSFNPNGQLISKVRYSGGMGDCGFMKTDYPILMNDSFLVVHANDWEGDCNEETTESESSTIFEYKIEDGVFSQTREQNIELKRKYSNVSTELLKEVDVKELSKDELAEMRNELFASYGYKFKTDKWSNYFKQMDWYKPNKDVVPEQELTLVEQMNLELIKRIENG